MINKGVFSKIKYNYQNFSLTMFSQSIMILEYKENLKGKGWGRMDIMKKALDMHAHYSGKLEVISKVPMQDSYDLSLAYSPGVAAPCVEIEKKSIVSL